MKFGTCTSCSFYVEKNLKTLLNKNGNCRLFPPVPVYDPTIKGISYELPKVRGDFDWCGQFLLAGHDDGNDDE